MIIKVKNKRQRIVRDGFTLVETLVAISLLAIAIVAPMSLTTQSLVGAYYSRDQVTAFFLAQEALEAVRSVRDANVLATALGTPTDLMSGIPSTGVRFTVDAHTVPVTMVVCPSNVCPPLQTDGELYGYQSGWDVTNFTRYVTANYVAGSSNNEIKVSATVTWQTAAYQPRTFTVSENLYRWIFDSTAITNVLSKQTFTSSGTYTVPSGATAIDALIVAGGGGGAGGAEGGGGGGGGVLEVLNFPVTAGQTFAVVVGAGGIGANGGNGGNGGNSSIAGVGTAIGGGGGGAENSNGNTGGAGGGAGGLQGAGANGTSGQGFAGGAGTSGGGRHAGGGGGAGAAGASGAAGGNGGPGFFTSVEWNTLTYGGGGGGSNEAPFGSGAGGQGGSGGGGAACGGGARNTNADGVAGLANTGGGGGAGGRCNSTSGTGSWTGGAGGSGVVIIQPR